MTKKDTPKTVKMTKQYVLGETATANVPTDRVAEWIKAGWTK